MSVISVYLERVDRDFLELHYEETVNALYPERKSRVLAFRRREPAYVSMTAGLMLQRLVQRELAIAPERLQLCKNENGKPMVEGHPEFCFNLSHSGDWVALAYGWDTPVGIDIEGIRRMNLRVAKRCYTRAEYRYVECGEYRTENGTYRMENAEYVTDVESTKDTKSADEKKSAHVLYEIGESPADRQSEDDGGSADENGGYATAGLLASGGTIERGIDDEISSRLVRVWTMKEAYLKLTGQGITVPMNSFSVDPVRETVVGKPYRYDLHRVEDYWLAVCVRTEEKIKLCV